LRADTGIAVGSLDPSKPKFVVTTDVPAIYSDGYLFFVRQQALLAQPFDPGELKLAGSAITVAEHIRTDRFYGDAAFSVSRNGVVAYTPGSTTDKSTLTWLNRKGSVERTLGQAGSYGNPVLSPDGKRIAVELDSGDNVSNIWMLDPVTGSPSRFTFGRGSDLWPVWSSDSASIVFDAVPLRGPSRLVRKTLSGAATEESLVEDAILFGSESWSSDRDRLTYVRTDPAKGFTVNLLAPVKRGTIPVPLFDAASRGILTQFSPDGHWIAYMSDETGKYEVSVQPFPATGSKWQISSSTGLQPRWRPDGRELFFMAYGGTLFAVDIGIGAAFEHGAPHPLFDMPNVAVGMQRNSYDVTADGQHFLVNAYPESTAEPTHIIVNWKARIE